MASGVQKRFQVSLSVVMVSKCRLHVMRSFIDPAPMFHIFVFLESANVISSYFIKEYFYVFLYLSLSPVLLVDCFFFRPSIKYSISVFSSAVITKNKYYMGNKYVTGEGVGFFSSEIVSGLETCD